MNAQALDRWITGNYGQDQYADLVDCPECGALVDPDSGPDPYSCPECNYCLQTVGPDPDAEYDRRRDRLAEEDDE